MCGSEHLGCFERSSIANRAPQFNKLTGHFLQPPLLVVILANETTGVPLAQNVRCSRCIGFGGAVVLLDHAEITCSRRAAGSSSGFPCYSPHRPF